MTATLANSSSDTPDLATLELLARDFPNTDAAASEIARLSAILTLPKGTVHVISDMHGEDKKLRHVINNASGTLRPLAEELFGNRMTPEELAEFMKLLFYPAEVTERLEQTLTDPATLREYAIETLYRQFELVRVLVAQFSLKRAMGVFPAEYRELLIEMLHQPTTDRGPEFVGALVDELIRRGRALHLVHLTGRLIRNLAIDELIIAGDCWDRGPRGDHVVDYLRQQPHVSFVWGNHDAAWLGAALGHEALICTVLRLSLRYRRLSQLDEGYSVPLTPLEHLARTVYADDPARHFMPQAEGLRPREIVARMQKAAAIMQFKLEGQMIARNPQWNLEHRRLLHRIDHAQETITIDGKIHPLRDTCFPTVDPDDPYRLTPEEHACLQRVRHSFTCSGKLWEHMQYLVSHGSMYLRRDECLIFHGCVPCDAGGNFLPMSIEGDALAGRALFEAIDRVILRALEKRLPADLDTLWYLWSGPRSPLFGKDRIATFERDFIVDEATHHEIKDHYFRLIHESAFCDQVLAEFGVDPATGLIVNGHVPVKVDKGESPLKRSGRAITIDGAFSEAYGDHGYTLVLEPGRIILAKHHHFESVDAALEDGVDIVPSVQVIRTLPQPRRMGDSDRGHSIRLEIGLLEGLCEAYRRNRLHEAATSSTGRALRSPASAQ